MNLDDLTRFQQLDPQNMLGEIDKLPDQLEIAWDLGFTHELPEWKDLRCVLIAGMGGSAIGADLLDAYVCPFLSVPIVTVRDYQLPAWAQDPDVLVITSSHSGNTEEALAAHEAAVERGCSRLAITTGGKLADAATDAGTTLWTYVHHSQPRTAVGFSFGLLLAVFSRLNLIPDPQEELQRAIQDMQMQQESLQAHVPVVKNPAKRMAGQLVGRWVTVIGSDLLTPVVRRWKTQLNELAKAWAQFEFLPEADHNTLAGIINPPALFSQQMTLFLQAGSNHPRNRLRSEMTRQLFMVEGLNTDFIQAVGDTRLSQLWTVLHFGDYVSYYLAMAYGVDPMPVDTIESLKIELRQTDR